MPDLYGWGGPQQSQFYGPSFDMASRIEEIRQQQMMAGQEPIPEFSGDPRQYIQLLAATNHQDIAGSLAASMGVDLPTLMQEAASAGYYEGDPMGGLLGKTLGFVGENIEPITKAAFLAPLALGALGGAFGGGAAAGGGAAGGSSAGLSPITVGAAPMAGGVPAVNAASAAAWGGSIPAMSSFPSGLGAMVGDGLSPITVNASRMAGGVPSVDAASSSAWGGSGGGGMWEGLLGGLSNWGPLVGGLLGAVDAHNQPDSMTSNQGGNSASQYFTTLPDEIRGPAMDALASLRGIFGNGYQVAGADPASMAAVSGLQSFAGGGGINPYLDTVFNSAADSTQTRLASEFARSGRNIQASAPARSEELQHLAAGIYGPGYEAERSRQFGSLLPLLGAGDYMRGINQQQLDAPQIGLERFLGGLGGLMPLFPGTQNQTTQQTGSVTQPLFNNPWAGFLGGAQLGSLFSQG